MRFLLIKVPDEPKAGPQVLSKEAVLLTMKVIQDGTASVNLSDALEIGYKGFGEIACTDAGQRRHFCVPGEATAGL